MIQNSGYPWISLNLLTQDKNLMIESDKQNRILVEPIFRQTQQSSAGLCFLADAVLCSSAEADFSSKSSYTINTLGYLYMCYHLYNYNIQYIHVTCFFPCNIMLHIYQLIVLVLHYTWHLTCISMFLVILGPPGLCWGVVHALVLGLRLDRRPYRQQLHHHSRQPIGSRGLGGDRVVPNSHGLILGRWINWG